MTLDQRSRPLAASIRRTTTWTPISWSALRPLLLGLLATTLLLLPFLGLTPVVSAQAFPARAVAPAAPELYYGLAYPGTPDIPTLRKYETEIGKGASIVMWYQSWNEGNQMQAFPTAQMEAVREHGSIPMLAWQPNAFPGPLNQPAYSLAKIADGAWDAYLRHYAEAAKAWGHPFFLRFASEMNGSWVPWYE